MHRIMGVIILCLSLVGVTHLQAQRSGFIIGLGIGAGVTSYSFSDVLFGASTSEGDTKGGLATDFKIGAQVSKSLQIYYLGRTNWLNDGRHTVAAGISALGVTYVLPSAPVHLSGGVGLATWLVQGSGGAGFGLTGGVGWEFADLWLLDFALTYGRPSDRGGHMNMFLARVGISILSH